MNHKETNRSIRELIAKAKETGNWRPVEEADVSEVTIMYELFWRVKGIQNLDLSGWDTSNVVDMGGMFQGSDINHPSVGKLNTSNTVSMEGMFHGSEYNHPIYFDTSKAIDMRHMFSYSQYNYPLYFNTSKVRDFRHMFEKSIYNHPLDTFDFSEAQNVREMFECSKYTYPVKQIDTIGAGGTTPTGADKLAKIHERNTRLQYFLLVGECEDINKLIEEFEGNEEAIALIKQKHLEVSPGKRDQLIVNPTSSSNTRI